MIMDKKQPLNIFILISVITLLVNFNTAQAEGNFSLFLGSKTLDEQEWEPVHEQAEVGFLFDYKFDGMPIHFAIDYLSSEDTSTLGGISFTGETTELDIGVRKYFEIENPKLHPYVGGGIAFIEATFSGLGLSDTDSATGTWFNAGIRYDVTESFHIGAEFRSSSADVTLFGVNADAGGGHFGFIAGLSF